MPKTREQKENDVAQMNNALQIAKSIVLVNYGNLNVSEATQLRFVCKKEGVSYKVAKKTLLSRALKDAGLTIDESTLQGQVGIAAGDEVAPAKVLSAFGKGRDTFKILGGFLEKNFIDASDVIALARLPSMQELRAQLVGTLQAPISGFVRTLSGTFTGLVRVLGAHGSKKVI